MHPGSSHPNPPDASQPQEPAAVLEDLGQVVLNDDQNLIIRSQDSAAMSRAAQSLQAYWRTQAPDVSVEHFTGDQRLAMLGHINLGIAQLGLDQAMQTPTPPYLPRQIAIITHAEHLPASDVQMLQDLTRHLPGLRWRWVLLCLDESGGERGAATASMNPSTAHPQWVTESAPVAPVAPVAAVAPAVPLEPGSPVEPFFMPTEALGSDGEVSSAKPAALAAAPTSPPFTPQGPASASAEQPSNLMLWLGMSALLVLGAWAIWLLFEVTNPSRPTTGKRAAAAAAQASAKPATPSAAAPQPVNPDVPSTPPDLSENRVASAAPAVPATVPQAPAPASAPTDTSAEVPDIALRGVRWLALQSPEFFVLEHGAFQTAAQAQSLIKTRDELANARVLMRKTTSPGGRFLVITGPFRSLERAQNYKVRENLPPQIQVRRVSDVLQESVRAAPSRP